VAAGGVHVHQDGATPRDKGVDIKGDLLKLLHFLQGDILYVFGEPRRNAELQLGDLVLIGPQVTINQRDNMAEVQGLGTMHLPAKTTFDGTKAAKPGSRLTVHWNKDMTFDGKHADFHGGAEAYQDEAKLLCHNLQVTLDRAISFKEGQKGGQEAKVEIMLCDGKVFIVNEKKDEKTGTFEYDRLLATQAWMDKTMELARASGPGRVYLFRLASKDQKDSGPSAPAQAKPPRPAGPADKELQLTRIDFSGRMASNNKEDTRISRFYDNVEVNHAPADNPDIEFNPDRPPKGGFYLRCDLLTVYSMPVGKDKDKSVHQMQADRNVTFKSQEFFGHATVVKYNESQDQMIFEGPESNPAQLFQFQGPSVPPREIKGTKILYNRKTGQFTLEGGSQIESGIGP
jgi:hypothetical protein